MKQSNLDSHLRAKYEARIRELSNLVLDPCARGFGAEVGLSDLGLIKKIGLEVRKGGVMDVRLTMCVTEAGCYYLDYFSEELTKLLKPEPWVADVSIEWVSHLEWDPSEMSETARKRLKFARAGWAPETMNAEQG